MIADGSANMAIMLSEREFRAGGWFHMETAAKYRKFADECERLARIAKDKSHCETLREMAEVWRTLAKEAKQANG